MYVRRRGGVQVCRCAGVQVCRCVGVMACLCVSVGGQAGRWEGSCMTMLLPTCIIHEQNAASVAGTSAPL